MFGIPKQQPSGKQMLLATEFKRLPGHLYFVKSDEKGNLCLHQTLMQKGSKRKEAQQ